MRFATRDHVQPSPALSTVRRVQPRAPRWCWWCAEWGMPLGRRLVIGLGSLAVFGVEHPGTWMALAGVSLSFALDRGHLRRWEPLGTCVEILLLGGTGVYGLLDLLRVQ